MLAFVDVLYSEKIHFSTNHGRWVRFKSRIAAREMRRLLMSWRKHSHYCVLNSNHSQAERSTILYAAYWEEQRRDRHPQLQGARAADKHLLFQRDPGRRFMSERLYPATQQHTAERSICC